MGIETLVKPTGGRLADQCMLRPATADRHTMSLACREGTAGVHYMELLFHD